MFCISGLCCLFCYRGFVVVSSRILLIVVSLRVLFIVVSLRVLQIVIHSLILSGGTKMSKSRGNIINPMSVINGASSVVSVQPPPPCYLYIRILC